MGKQIYYTKFDNEYPAQLARLELNGSEFRVLLYLIRYSACFERDYTRAKAASIIGEDIGMSDRQVKRALKGLLNKKLIYIDYEHSSGKGNSYFMASDKLGHMKGHIWSIGVTSLVNGSDKNVPKVVTDMSHTKNTGDNNIEINNRERASLTFLPCETIKMQQMSEEERQKYIELLPEDLRNKNPDDYTELEWDIYDEWRCKNGLI